MGTHLVGLFRHGNRGTDLSSAAAVHDTVIPDEVTNDADGVVESALGLVDDLDGSAAILLVVPAIRVIADVCFSDVSPHLITIATVPGIPRHQ